MAYAINTEPVFVMHKNKTDDIPYEENPHIPLQSGDEATRRQYLISGLCAQYSFFNTL